MSVKAVNSPEEVFDTRDKIDMWLRGREEEGRGKGGVSSGE